MSTLFTPTMVAAFAVLVTSQARRPGATGVSTVPLAIPPVSGLGSMSFIVQGLVMDPAGASNGLQIRLGRLASSPP